LVPEWRGDIFFGSLNSGFLGRLDPEGTGPGGAIWFLSVIDGAVYRMAPEG
jgi:hypothetical protein